MLLREVLPAIFCEKMRCSVDGGMRFRWIVSNKDGYYKVRKNYLTISILFFV